MEEMILIVDLGSEKNAELARYIRSLGVYSEVRAYDLKKDEISNLVNINGVILNKGRNQEVNGVLVEPSEDIKSLDVPFLTLDDNSKENRDEIKDFVYNKAKAEKTWNAKAFVEDEISKIKNEVGDKKVLLALSGGVDSSVVAALLIKAIGNQLTCVHVNHGLLRKNESENVLKVFRDEFGMAENLVYVDALFVFLDK